VIEFNVRFGDPEAQVVLPLLDDPLAPLLWDAANGTLQDRVPRSQQSRVAVGVVLAAHGYPSDVRTGDVIHGLEELERQAPDALVFHAGVTSRGRDLVTSGGRVMTVVSREDSYETAISGAYAAASHLRFDGMHYRRDIGRKALIS
jgi:phosphoribosylamine--glycine ligase